MISTNLHLWPSVAEAQRRGAKVVVIDPVRHRTAAHADWYIPIRPGTDGALALALMNVFSWGHLYVTLNTPAIEPVGEAISNTELFRRLAARMGFTEECFTRTDEQMMAEAFDWSAPALESHAYLNSSAGDQPAQRRVQGEQAVTVHPHDAAERGITDGQYVRVYNDRGQFIALAQVRDDIAAGVVMAPMGAWRKNAKGHSTVNAVNPFVFADLGNARHSPTPGSRSNPPKAATASRKQHLTWQTAGPLGAALSWRRVENRPSGP